jgi:hypothetical protein
MVVPEIRFSGLLFQLGYLKFLAGEVKDAPPRTPLSESGLLDSA